MQHDIVSNEARNRETIANKARRRTPSILLEEVSYPV